MNHPPGFVRGTGQGKGVMLRRSAVVVFKTTWCAAPAGVGTPRIRPIGRIVLGIGQGA
jgi:hypothetical protein